MIFSPDSICARIVALRTDFSGPRGRADFARTLDLSPSTYNYYENSRVPPVDVLIRIAEITGARLEWLILGEEPRYGPAEKSGQNSPIGPIQAEVADLLGASPNLAPTLRAFLCTLRDVAEMKQAVARVPSLQAKVALKPRELVPIIGYTAASPVHFWEELDREPVASDIYQKIEQFVSGREVSQRISAEVAESEDAEALESGTVALVQLSAPDDRGVVEFLDAPAIRSRHPDALAWRIDGDSMSPRFQHGDLVVARTGVPARNDHPCIARLQGQIGVVCKVYEEQNGRVRLVSVNEAFPTQEFPREQLDWALEVLWSVRVAGT